MPRLEILPHRTAPRSAWRRAGWTVEVDDGGPQPVSGELEGWDYASTMKLRTRTVVDVDRVHEACRTSEDAEFQLVCVWDCQSSGIRRVGARHTLVRSGEQEIISELTIPPGLVAERIRVERQLILTRPGEDPGDFAPDVAGAIVLWERGDEWISIALEGSGGRFPVEVVDFSAQGRPGASWWLDVSYTDLDDSFLGAVRLYLNDGHPAIRALLEDPSSDQARATLSVIQWDATRKLLLRLVPALVEQGRESRQMEEGSVGEVVGRMCRSLLRRDPASVRTMIDRDEDRFELVVQEAMGVLEVG